MNTFIVIFSLAAMCFAVPVFAADTNPISGGITITNAIQNSSTNNQRDINAQVRQLNKHHAVLMKILNSRPVDWNAFEQGARTELADFPDLMTRDIYANAYADFEILMNHYLSVEGDSSSKAGTLAREVVASSAPEHYRLTAAGFLNRLESVRKPMVIKFMAMDGREVDTSKMSGKVVLIDFWAIHCPGCVLDVPKIKVAYDTFHDQGLEIIGINCDEDAKVVRRFLKSNDIAWPQCFENESGMTNKFSRQFGIYGIPHMMLLDKKGCLRFDGVAADDKFIDKIAKLNVE